MACLLTGVGRAFEEELSPHPELLKLFFGTEDEPKYDNPWKKMTMVRQCDAKLLFFRSKLLHHIFLSSFLSLSLFFIFLVHPLFPSFTPFFLPTSLSFPPFSYPIFPLFFPPATYLLDSGTQVSQSSYWNQPIWSIPLPTCNYAQCLLLSWNTFRTPGYLLSF